MSRLSRLGRSTAGRTAIVTEGADAIRSQLLPAADSIHGVILPIDGGMTTTND